MTVPSWSYAFLKARRSSEAALECVTFFHPMIQTFRIVKNDVDIISRGDTFKRSWFQCAVINDNDEPARATMTVPNLGIGRDIGWELRKIVGPLRVTLEVLSSADLENPIYRAPGLLLAKIKINQNNITGDLTRHDYSTETFGKVLVTPAKFPSLLRAYQG